MNNKVYINRIAKFLPNDPVLNDDMEDYLGKIKGLKSRCKPIVLRNNGIKKRHYALDQEGRTTHLAPDLDVAAIEQLFDTSFSKDDIQLLACGSSTPEQLIPSHASMVHGRLGGNPVEINSPSGTCNTSMQALKYGFMSVLSGQSENAVCSASQRVSKWLIADNFEEEVKYLDCIGDNPFIAFEKEFLRWMLSDGAGALLLQNSPNAQEVSLNIDFIEIRSFANQVETCMYAGGIKDENGELIPWKEFSQTEQMQKSIFSISQEIKLLEANITKLGVQFFADLVRKGIIDVNSLNYFLPHISSEFFRKKMVEDLKEELDIEIPQEIWYTNLSEVGNIGAASAFVLLEEIFNSGNLKKGETILLMVPESARFSYTFAQFTVV